MMAPPRILFIHQDFPAQFGGLASYLQAQGWGVLFATASEKAVEGKITTAEGLKLVGCSAHREPAEGVHRYVREVERAALNAQGFAQVAVKLLHSGYVPDIVVAHSGSGLGSFSKAVWPEAKFVQYLEWWVSYPPREGDARQYKDAASRKDAFDNRALAQCLNLPMMMDFMVADAVIVPSRFQASTLPAFLRSRAEVIHDGVDCDFYAPAARAPLETTDGRIIAPETPLITYAARGTDPTRGLKEFMEALSKLQARDRDVHAVIVEDPDFHDGDPRPRGASDKQKALGTRDLDPSRIHRVGQLPPERYRELLCSTDCHVYLTRPFVLSSSLANAMAAGCPLVVSDNAATRDALPNERFAVHVDHDDTDALADAIGHVLEDRERSRMMGMAARRRALRQYDQKAQFPAHAQLFRKLMGKIPA